MLKTLTHLSSVLLEVLEIDTTYLLRWEQEHHHRKNFELFFC